jgi:hypothetical protein
MGKLNSYGKSARYLSGEVRIVLVKIMSVQGSDVATIVCVQVARYRNQVHRESQEGSVFYCRSCEDYRKLIQRNM